MKVWIYLLSIVPLHFLEIFIKYVLPASVHFFVFLS